MVVIRNHFGDVGRWINKKFGGWKSCCWENVLFCVWWWKDVIGWEPGGFRWDNGEFWVSCSGANCAFFCTKPQFDLMAFSHWKNVFILGINEILKNHKELLPFISFLLNMLEYSGFHIFFALRLRVIFVVCLYDGKKHFKNFALLPEVLFCIGFRFWWITRNNHALNLFNDI